MRAIQKQQLGYERMEACVKLWDQRAEYYEVRQVL